MNIVSSALGLYSTSRPDASEYDCIIGNSFGTSTEKGSPNYDIIGFCLWEAADGKPLIVDRTLADVSYQGYGKLPIDHVVEGEVSTTTGGGTGTWGVLTGAAQFMKRRWNYGHTETLRPLLIGQANHIGRIAMQARKLGMEPVVYGGMTRKFDHHSEQPWTRNLALWLPREILGSFVLKKKGQL